MIYPMRKILILCMGFLILSGCSTYKYVKGVAPYEGGYVVTRDAIVVPEYTVGKDNSAPDLDTAKARFQRRRPVVEDYYTKMGHMESRFKEVFLDPPVMAVKFFVGILTWPFTAVADYKYEHNPEYRNKIHAQEDAAEEVERKRIADLQAKLAGYIQQDIAAEGQEAGKAAPRKVSVQQEINASVVRGEVDSAAAVLAEPVLAQQAEKPIKPAPLKKVAAEVKSVNEQGPIAVIKAVPIRGFSPLKVSFVGSKSYSPGSRIATYDWDFGDGDKSTKANPVNTYFSATYGTRIYQATLTVKDSLGRSATVTQDIELLTR
jgi:hypothetical protein